MTIPPPTGVTVDAHHHLWDPAQGDYPWMTGRFAPLRREYATEQLIPELTAHSVHATVVVQVRADSAETRDLLALTTRHRFLAGVVGWVDLASAQVARQIEALRSGPGGQRLVAVRHDVSAEPDPQWLLRADVQRGLEDIADAGLAFDLEVTPRELASAVQVAVAHPDLRFVLDHLGKPPIAAGGSELWRRFSYFKQLFAQVTNPPIDPIREEIVMSLATTLGSERNLFEETPEHAHKLVLDQPILLNRELETLRHVSHDVFAARTINITWSREDGAAGIRDALARICRESSEAIAERVNIIVLSDRLVGPRRVPVPSLLAVAAVHHHLVREGTRLRAGIILESGEPREVHHFATLIGYGAVAINPYLLLETLDDLVLNQRAIKRIVDGEEVAVGAVEAAENLVKALGKALLKTISKMGISTIQSYCGAQIFEAVGLEPELIDRHFTGTASRIGGVGVNVLAEEALERHARAYPVPHDQLLPVGGVYAWRRDGEHHQWNPETIALVQHAVRAANGDVKAALGGDVERAGDGARQRRVREVSRVRADDQRGRGAQGDAARPLENRQRRARARRARAGRAGGGDRQAVLHGSDEPRLDLARGARDAGDRDEPARRALEHG